VKTMKSCIIDVEKEIDRRIELMGIRLESDQEDLRAQLRMQIEKERILRELHPELPPTYKFPPL
jgi:hypothetical protein